MQTDTPKPKQQLAKHYADSPVPEIREHHRRLTEIAGALAECAPVAPTQHIVLSDEQIKAHGDRASGMMARDMTRFDAACEVMNYLKEQGAPYYYMYRMGIVLHGNYEGTEAARAPDKAAPVAPAPQPAAPQGDGDMLRAHAEGRVTHINNGLCPDIIEGHDTRDPECPVCQALLENHVALPAPPQGAAKGATA